MNIKRGKIKLENLQVKSLEKAKRLAYAIDIIEEECGIHSVEISIEGFFICPEIDFMMLNEPGIERLLSRLFSKVRQK